MRASPDRARRPSDTSATVRIEVYASFEFQPTLGAGEQLRKLTTTVEQLLDRCDNSVREWNSILHNDPSTYSTAAFTFFPKNGDVVSPCSSILVTLERQKCKSSNSSTLKVLGTRYVRG